MRILLAGVHRCGSTWVANVLARTPDLRTVYEPDEPNTDILGTIASDRLGRFPALQPTDESSQYTTVWEVAFAGGWPWGPTPMRRRVGRLIRSVPAPVRSAGLTAVARASMRARARTPSEHVLVKSANCAFSLEWIEERFRPRIVVQRRSPLSVVASWIALDLEEDVSLAHNSSVQERWLQPLGIPTPPAGASRLVRVAWTVGLLSRALKETADRHPDWVLISHDQLCQDPVPGFIALCERLGLTWSAEAEEYLEASDRPGFVDKHRNPRRGPRAAGDATTSQRDAQAGRYAWRLSEDQIAEARSVLAPFQLGAWADETPSI